MKTLLHFQSCCDNDNRAVRKKVSQQRGQKRLRTGADAGAGHNASLLQSPLQGLHGGSFHDGGKKHVCLRPYRISCQARPKSHAHGGGVKRRWEISNDEVRMTNKARNRNAGCVASIPASSLVILSSCDIWISDFSNDPSCTRIQSLENCSICVPSVP